MNDDTTQPDADDTEGHKGFDAAPGASTSSEQDDVQGHRTIVDAAPGNADEDDDVAGHKGF